MVRITNHTDNIELETDNYTLYIDSTKEITFRCLESGLTDLEEIEEFYDLDSYEQDRLSAVNYFDGDCDSVSELQERADDMCLYNFEGCTTVYEMAHYLMFDLNSDEELLYMILGCNKEAYEQLGSYITTDDLVRQIELVCDTFGSWLKLN